MSHNAPHPPPLFTGEQDTSPRIPVVAWLHRHRHLTVPPLLLPVVLAAGITLASYHQQAATITASAVALVMMCFAARHKWDRPAEQWYACASTAAAGGWLSVVSFTGLTLVMVYVAAGLVAVWGAFWWHHKRPRPKRGDAALVDEWNNWWQHHARSWGLLGSTITGVVSKGDMEILEIQLWKGRQHPGQIQEAAKLIASALGGYTRPGMIRVDAHPADSSKVLLVLKRQDPLRHPLVWSAALGINSILEAAAIGFTELGTHIKVSLRSNWFIIGRTRSGKSNELSNFLAAITGCSDALVWLVDMKGGRAARPWMPAVDWCAVEMSEIQAMFNVALAEIKARARDAYTGDEQLVATPECPAIFLCIDETYEVTGPAGLASLATQLASITSQGMGVEVYVVVLTQYGALDESVRTEQTRSNLLNRLLFAVSMATHGAFAIPEYDKMDASKLEQQGAFYMKLGPKATPAPGRGFEFPHDLVRDVARRNGAMPRQALRLYAAEHQETYDQRWSRLPQSFWRNAPQTEGLTAAQQASATATVQASAAAPVQAAAVAAPAPGVHSPDVMAAASQIEADLTGADIPESSFRMPSDEELRSAISRNRAALARALTVAPADGIAPKQLMEATGLSRTYVMGQLKALCDLGVVGKPSTGRYVASPGADVWTAMEQIREANGRLLATAS